MVYNVLITGASRGIGKAIALAFDNSPRECRLFLTYNTNEEKMNQLLTQLKHEAIGYQLDVRDREGIKNLIHEITIKYGNIDVLINNAGINKDKTLKNLSDEEWDEVIAVNLTGIFNVTKEVLHHMNDNGCIINTASIIGIIGNFGQTNYAASKAGIIAFTKSLSKEVVKRGIRVMAIAPGFVETDMVSALPDEIKKKLVEKIPLGRFALPEEIGELVIFLAYQGTYCTGQVYVIDGGMT